MTSSESTTTRDTARLGCSASAGDSERIPYRAADLGPSVHGGIGYVPGPSGRAIVRDQAEWARVWKTLADTIALPKVNFRDSILVIVASQEYTSGPFRLEIEDVRSCRQSETIVVRLRLHTQEAMQDYGDRSIRGVLLPRLAIRERAILFVELPQAVDR